LCLGIAINKNPCVYILSSVRNGTLYVGVMSDLLKRIWEHKNDVIEGFTKLNEWDIIDEISKKEA
jgi:predicted GIY-YIG superfamily endonuclease